MTGILDICRSVADITATQRPDDLFNSSMQHNTIFLSVAENELESLLRYGDWPELVKEGRFKTIRNKTYYSFDQIIPDFYSLTHNTLFIKDRNEQILGAVTYEEGMRRKYLKTSSGDLEFRIENNGLRFFKIPEANLNIVFLYRSNAVCYDAVTGEEKKELEKNDDIPVFDKYIVKLGIIWRWLKRSGMDYTEEYNEYQKELKRKYAVTLETHDISLTQGRGAESCGTQINLLISGD